MIYDVNYVDTEEAFTVLKVKLTRADSVTYTCKCCNVIVTKNSRCYKNFNNLCHSCSVKHTCSTRDSKITKAIYEKVQHARKAHQAEINAHVSAGHAKRTKEQKQEAYLKTVNTCNERYGAFGFGLQAFKNTMVARYGASTTLQSEQLKAKVQATNLVKYGSISPASNDAIKQKIIKTYTQKHGGMGFASESAKHVQQLTMLERYGVIHNTHSHELTSKAHKKYIH